MAELSRLLKGGGRREGDTYRRFESKGVKDQITVNVAAYVLLLPVEYFIHDRFHLVSRRLARLILPEILGAENRERKRERERWIRRYLLRNNMHYRSRRFRYFAFLYFCSRTCWWSDENRILFSLLLCAALLSFVFFNEQFYPSSYIFPPCLWKIYVFFFFLLNVVYKIYCFFPNTMLKLELYLTEFHFFFFSFFPPRWRTKPNRIVLIITVNCCSVWSCRFVLFERKDKELRYDRSYNYFSTWAEC